MGQIDGNGPTSAPAAKVELFSRQISLRWSSPAEAPIYAAESILLSALFLIVTTLSLVWATLSAGRPWLRLLLSLSGAALLGAAVAYALTAPNHSHFLIDHVLFAAFIGLSQAIVIGGVLLRVRRRGLRLISQPRPQPLWRRGRRDTGR